MHAYQSQQLLVNSLQTKYYKTFLLLAIPYSLANTAKQYRQKLIFNSTTTTQIVPAPLIIVTLNISNQTNDVRCQTIYQEAIKLDLPSKSSDLSHQTHQTAYSRAKHILQCYKIVIVSILVYYILQLFFIPSVRYSLDNNNKIYVRLLLIICCIPIFALAVISLKYKYLILKILSFFTLAHVLFNDALLYGFLF